MRGKDRIRVCGGQSPLALYAKQTVRHHRRKIQEESDGQTVAGGLAVSTASRRRHGVPC